MNHLAASTTSKPARQRDMRLNVWAIRNEADYERTREVVDALVFRPRLTREERERLDVMMALMEAWEKTRYAIPEPGGGPLGLLRDLMAEHAMSASDLGRLLGNRALGSLILNGKRELSKAHIRKLADHFAVSPAAFF